MNSRIHASLKHVLILSHYAVEHIWALYAGDVTFSTLANLAL